MTARLLRIDPWNPDPGAIEEAARVIRAGGLVAFPTETVYGLGADGTSSSAVAGIFRAKGRPADNPLILHFASPWPVSEVAVVTPTAERLMELFWPGPLTLVLPSLGVAPREVSAGLDTVAVRMPSHPVALALISRAGVPVAAPSANTSGRPSPTDAEAVVSDVGARVDIVLDGGPTFVGVESTVLDVTGEELVLLRPGGCPVEEIEAKAGLNVLLSGGDGRRSPGVRYRHYAPRLPLLLNPTREEVESSLSEAGPGGTARIAWIGMREPEGSLGEGLVQPDMSVVFDTPENYARGLFHALRTFERMGADIIAARLPDSDRGICRAIRDRLERAASDE
ncbi:MAG: threonylcarbamoyl-AMP synthase [Synergistaceae bacterium]|nr:L-threonylcarbamoyladenylate synthase [Synergistota bacterium]NLM71700.1 threonylcarbamoyl-AMP synthase [Synergistaceae bacterium]